MPRSSRTGMRGLYRDSDGRWSIDLRWREPSTGEWRRYRERLPAKLPAAAAKGRAREIMAAALAGGFNPKREAPRRLKDAFKEYIGWCEANRPTAREKREATTYRLLTSIGDLPLDAVSPFHVEKFKKLRLDEGAAPATVNRDLEVLSHFYGLAARWGWVYESHARAIRTVPHLKEPPGRVRYLTDDEEARVLGALPDTLVRIVVAALLSGMRQSEIVTLRKDAVDLKSRIITLVRTKSNRVRRVYVNDAFAAVLEEAMTLSPCEFVFANTRGEAYTSDGLRTIFRRSVKKAGVENFRFHDLRHTTATRLRRQGVGIDAVAEVLGHSSLAMALRYAHLGKDVLRQAMATLPTPAEPKVTALPTGKAKISRVGF